MSKERKEENADFNWEEIIIRCYFDDSPISRSQAKDLCSRMNGSKKISLDFDGVEWMGQGFAHQLFVVYQSANPDVELLPRNMNAAVQRMYNHVTYPSRRRA